MKGLEYKSLSEDIVKHAQYHYNPGKDVVFRGEHISVSCCSCFTLTACHAPTCQRPACCCPRVERDGG